ncbi:basic helix-loop-helix protein [Parahypoxylon ruwenzoriense]
MESNGYSHSDSLLEPLAHINREHLAAMADAAVADQNDYNSSSPSSPSQKRKRGAPESSPDLRRAKRVAPTAAMSSTPDPASAAYVESAVEAAQAAAQAATDAGFTALQQATAEHDSSDHTNVSSTAAAALGTLYPTIHVPQPTEETFAAQTVAETEHHQDPSFGHNDMPDGLPDVSANNLAQQPSQNGIRPTQPSYAATPGSNAKPAVGSEEWHKMRKDNHKEVERRRRETINEGINELAKIVPGCEKNKGSILQRAVIFITQLKQNEAQNIEKWTLEKLLTEQAIQELSASNDKLKQECERAYRELAIWKQVAQSAGLQPPQTKEDPSSS